MDPDCDNCTVRDLGNCLACLARVLIDAQPKRQCILHKIEGRFRPTCNYSCALEHGCPIQVEIRRG